MEIGKWKFQNGIHYFQEFFFQKIKKNYFFKKIDWKNADFDYFSQESHNIDRKNLQALRYVRLLDVQLWSLIKEVFIFGIFLFFLYAVSFFNQNNSSFAYNQLFVNTFVKQQSFNEIGLNDVK